MELLSTWKGTSNVLPTVIGGLIQLFQHPHILSALRRLYSSVGLGSSCAIGLSLIFSVYRVELFDNPNQGQC
jgi:hypothetical protein